MCATISQMIPNQLVMKYVGYTGLCLLHLLELQLFDCSFSGVYKSAPKLGTDATSQNLQTVLDSSSPQSLHRILIKVADLEGGG